jgi:hypothetical protein
LQVRALPPELVTEDDDHSAGPAAAPRPRRSGSRGPGCGCALVALPVVIVAGLVVGRLLAGEDGGPTERSVTVAEGRAGAESWRVEAERDVEGDLCAFLYVDDEKLTGACTTAPQDATLDGGAVTVVFGRAPRDATRVRVGLAAADGTGADAIEADTVPAGDVEGRYYVVEVPGDVDASGTLEVVTPGR